MSTKPKAPAWLKNYANLESAILLLSYPGKRVGYNYGTEPNQWFLCKCNERKADHQPCPQPYKFLHLKDLGGCQAAFDQREWLLREWMVP